MIIEDLQEEDIYDAVALLKECYDEMNYDDVGHNFDIMTVYNSLFYGMNNCIAIVAKELDNLTGIAVVLFLPSLMNINHTMAIETVWHSRPGIHKIKRSKVMIKLLDEMERMVKERGLKYIHINSSNRFKSVSKYLDKKDYKLRELHYCKEVT